METIVIVRDIEYPVYSSPVTPPPPSVEELSVRLEHCKEMMRQRGLTHLLVYGDREHFANLMYLTNFDPRFEEALLIVRLKDKPLILVGNECVGHLGVSPLYVAGELRYERFQTFSLMNQPRNASRRFETILCEEGIGTESYVGMVGWKYFSDSELDAPLYASDIPNYMVDILRTLVPTNRLVNATDLFIAPSYGMRTYLSPYEVAFFEYSNVLGSEAMKSLLENFKAGVTDFEQMQSFHYNGFPLSCHMSIKSHGNQHYGLSSPIGSTICRGEPCSAGIAYWGSNICRAGWVAESEDDLPESAKGYIEEFAVPYFMALREWLRHLRIGTLGGDLYQLIAEMLPFDKFAVSLNPGHLIHLDEWLSSPVYEGSKEVIHSGMYIQIDIIPRSPRFSSSRMEEGIVIADDSLRGAVRKNYPAVYERCMERRQFMESLGFELPEEVLPLSNMAGIIVPFFLKYRSVLSLKK